MLPVALLTVLACHREFQRCSNNDDCTEVPPGAAQQCLIWSMESPGFCSWECEDDRDCAFGDGPARICTEFDPFDSVDSETCVQPCAGPEDCGRGWGCGDIGGSAHPELACYP